MTTSTLPIVTTESRRIQSIQEAIDPLLKESSDPFLRLALAICIAAGNLSGFDEYTITCLLLEHRDSLIQLAKGRLDWVFKTQSLADDRTWEMIRDTSMVITSLSKPIGTLADAIWRIVAYYGFAVSEDRFCKWEKAGELAYGACQEFLRSRPSMYEAA